MISISSSGGLQRILIIISEMERQVLSSRLSGVCDSFPEADSSPIKCAFDVEDLRTFEELGCIRTAAVL